MATTTITKTAGTVLLSHQAVTHPGTVVGTATSVSTAIAATVFLYHSVVEATANTNAGNFRIEVSSVSSGDEDWAAVFSGTVAATTADTEAMTATEPVGETVLAVASTTGFVVGDVLYIQDTGTLADSEWNRCKRVVSNTSIDLIDGLTHQKDSSDVIWNDAVVWPIAVDLYAVTRIRVVFHHEGATGADCHIKAIMVTADSASTT